MPRVGFLWAFLAGGLLAAGGCGGKQDVGYVSGKVTLNGQPLSKGSVVFHNPAKGIVVSAPLQPDGSYTAKTYQLAGLPPGEYQVSISPTGVGSGETPLAEPPKPSASSGTTNIPAKYLQPKTSGLKVTVQPGKNPPFDFNLSP
jgi:hypothetical protein